MDLIDLSKTTMSNERQQFMRQNSTSMKRPQLSFDETDHDGISMGKRACVDADQIIFCPLEQFGCKVEKDCKSAREHYLNSTHQKYLMIGIERYIQQLHEGAIDNSSSPKDVEDYSEIQDSIRIIEDSVLCLNDDNLELHNATVQMKSAILECGKELELLNKSIEETNQITHVIQMNTSIIETEIESLKQMMSDMLSQFSNDGTYLWKITNVSKKIEDAINERQTSIYSPPFYSSPTGYKMCMRLYLNGDGHARRTHISLFFVLMRGDFDAVLEWPFNYKITFCLYDQSGNQRHIIDSFRPDVKSNSFQRPRSNMNIASGIPKYCSLSILQPHDNPYIVDDCMFIRCIVDFLSTPKTMLSYICNLNPGFPSTVRKELIESEMERRKSATGNSSPKLDGLK